MESVAVFMKRDVWIQLEYLRGVHERIKSKFRNNNKICEQLDIQMKTLEFTSWDVQTELIKKTYIKLNRMLDDGEKRRKKSHDEREKSMYKEDEESCKLILSSLDYV